MNHKQEVMVSLGAAIGANCIPCFDYIYSRAKEVALTDTEINEVIETAFKVKNGAAVFLKNAVSDVTGEVSDVADTCCGAAQSCCEQA
ncbi:MAG: carboxymuconolactone decarboxylase family protein [Desulfobacteraceae bacterium]|nr:carboxymuconolactone decarboxylase family protein [Desulfobacteraceae bacterium]